MRVRRVVTGHTAEGKATVASDTLVDPMTTALVPGMALHRLWGGDSVPVFPDAGAPRPSEQYFPPPGGFRFALFTVPPSSSAAVTAPVAVAKFEADCPGLLGSLESMETGMQTSDTTDFEYIVSGEVDLELDDGGRRHARAERDAPCVAQPGYRAVRGRRVPRRRGTAEGISARAWSAPGQTVPAPSV